MSQHHQYVHYSGPPGVAVQHHAPPSLTPQHHQFINGNGTIDTVNTAAATSGSTPSSHPQQPLVATGEWTKDLVHLARTAELKKHGLTLQLHTAHILSAHAALEQKSKAIQDVREQKNKLESERQRLLQALRQVNEDRDRAELLESTMDKECNDLRLKINQLSEGEYAQAKRDVDFIRQELGQPPLPSLQSMLDEKTSQYLTDRRLLGNGPGSGSSDGKRSAATAGDLEGQPPAVKRPRGRPKGSKNRPSKGGD